MASPVFCASMARVASRYSSSILIILATLSLSEMFLRQRGQRTSFAKSLGNLSKLEQLAEVHL